MAILAFFGKSIEKPYVGPFGDFGGLAPFLFGAIRQLVRGKKWIQKKHPAQKDLKRTICHLADSHLFTKYFPWPEIGQILAKKRAKK